MQDSEMADLVRTDLAGYAPASNLAYNERIQNLMKQGENVYHLAFGQSPFPVIEIATAALKENAHQNAYLPVSGLFDINMWVWRGLTVVVGENCISTISIVITYICI